MPCPLTLDHPCYLTVVQAADWLMARITELETGDITVPHGEYQKIWALEAALDEAARSLDVVATRRAAREFCQAWERVLRAHGWVPRRERPEGWQRPEPKNSGLQIRIVRE